MVFLGPVTSNLCLGLVGWSVHVTFALRGSQPHPSRLKDTYQNPSDTVPAGFPCGKYDAACRRIPMVHWGMCIVCCDERSICSYSQIGPCDGEICAGSLLIGSHYPPTQAQTLNQHQTQWNTHTHTHTYMYLHTHAHTIVPLYAVRSKPNTYTSSGKTTLLKGEWLIADVCFQWCMAQWTSWMSLPFHAFIIMLL